MEEMPSPQSLKNNLFVVKIDIRLLGTLNYFILRSWGLRSLSLIILDELSCLGSYFISSINTKIPQAQKLSKRG